MLAERRIRQRAGVSAAAEYGRLKREWRWRNRRAFRWLALICLGIAAMALIVSLGELRGWICGLIAGVALAFLILARETPPDWIERHLSGAAGEKRMAKAVEPLLRTSWFMTRDLFVRRCRSSSRCLLAPTSVTCGHRVDRTARYLDQVLALAKAFALCGARDEAGAIRNDVRMFTDVRAAILKIQNPDSGRAGSGAVEMDTAIGQLVNEAVAADEVVDIYKLAGIETPELSILSDEFLDSLVGKDKPNLQMGLLRRLINDQIRTVQRTNIVQARKFSEQLDEAINRYTNRALTTAEIVAELVKPAKDMRHQNDRHNSLGLSVAEAAFYEAIVQNDAAILSMGDETLKKIAVDVVWAVQQSATIDWSLKHSVRAAMRSKIRRLLAKYDYPPDHEEKAIELVLQQAELLAGAQ